MLGREHIGVRSPPSSSFTRDSDSALTLRCSDDLRNDPLGSSPLIYLVITENRKHPSSPECLVSMQKVMEGSELELAKVAIEHQAGGGRVASEGPAEPSCNPEEMVGALFLGLVEV